MGVVINLMTLVLILIAGLMGASGVVLAAAAAHAKSGMGLDGAGYLLLFHAVAVLSAVALLQQGLLLRPLVLCAWRVGAWQRDVCWRHRPSRLRRPPPVYHGRANRRNRTHSGMACARYGCHFGAVAQLIVSQMTGR
jgi:hypothetical protein